MISNILRANRWEVTNGKPLGWPDAEYRLLYLNDQCIACYIFPKNETMDLPAYQQAIRGVQQ